MKYWLLTTEYPPFHGGGISTYCYYTAQMLSAAGLEVTVFLPDDSVADRLDSGEEDAIRVIRFNSNRSKLHESLGYTVRLSYEFAGIVRAVIGEEGRPDYIESQDYLGIAYYLQQFRLLRYKDLTNVPIIITLHSPAFIYLEYNRAPTYKFPDFQTCEMEKYSIKAADSLISPTRFLTEEISQHIDISDKHLTIIPNPYQDADIQGIPAFQRNKIVYYGKLSPQKGSLELLEYMKELWDEGFPYPLYLIGGTDIVYYPEMLTMGQIVREKYGFYIKKGLLLFHDKINPSKINETLSDAHIIILPSIVDNLPYVVLEAMHLGKIVLASVQGGQREMIEDGENGFLFDHQQAGSFKARLLFILELNDEQVCQIGEKARERVKLSYSFEKICAQKRELLHSLMKCPSENREFPFLYQEPLPLHFSPADSGELLSVVVPYYNMGPFIGECIQSILQSTYSPLEILVINDGSTDDFSLQQLERIEVQGKVRVIHQKNKGLAETRNEGARLAQGRYLAFLDADDKVAASYYEKAIRVLMQYQNVYFIGSWVQYFENSRAIWPSFNPTPPYALVHNPVNSSALVYKREAFLEGGMNDRLVDYGIEDYESVINMLSHGFNGVVLPECLFYYRVRNGSMFRNVNRYKLLYSNKYISQKHNQYYSKFATPIINLINANGPGYLFDNPSFGLNITSSVEHISSLRYTITTYIKKNKKLKRIALILKKKLKL